MLRTGDALIGELGMAIEHDPEVRQARTIADAARKRLVACMTGTRDVIDPAEAQRMLDAFRNAQAHAEDAEDRVLMHRGLLTSVEAGRRAARRRPVLGRPDAGRPAGTRAAGTGPHGQARTGKVGPEPRADRPARRGVLGRAVACALALMAAGGVGVALARWLGVRPPLARWLPSSRRRSR